MKQPYNEHDVDVLYRLLGMSVWHLQHLENVLSSYTTLVILQRRREKGAKITENDLQQSFKKQQNQTLSPLIGSAKAHKTLPKHLYPRFEKFLNERNWVIHNCVVNEYLSLRNEKDKTNLFIRIGNFADEATQLTKEIYILFESWFKTCGYDIKAAHLNAETILLDAEKN